MTVLGSAKLFLSRAIRNTSKSPLEAFFLGYAFPMLIGLANSDHVAVIVG